MVFWDNEKIAKRAYLNTQVPHQRDAMMKIVDKIWSIVPKSREETLTRINPNAPIIYGSFTNWEPQSMLEITDLSETFEK